MAPEKKEKRIEVDDPAQVFYQCQRCGNCCRWPGGVKCTQEDISAMARLLDMDLDSFIQTFTDLHPQRTGLVLKNHPDGRCIFLEGKNHCQVQSAKPHQCKGFPNRWNFPGWRDVCEAIPVPVTPEMKTVYEES